MRVFLTVSMVVVVLFGLSVRAQGDEKEEAKSEDSARYTLLKKMYDQSVQQREIAMKTIGVLTTTVKGNTALIKALEADKARIQVLVDHLGADAKATSTVIRRLTDTISVNRNLITMLQQRASAHKAAMAQRQNADRHKHVALAGIFKEIGSSAVLPMAAALERDPASLAPVLCGALENLGTLARPAIPALRRVRDNTTGEPARLAGQALAAIGADDK